MDEVIGLYTESGKAVSTIVYSISHKDVFIIINAHHSLYSRLSSVVESLVLTSRGLFLTTCVYDKSEVV